MSDRKISPLFRYLERVQGARPWGRVLDAGTGRKSLSWISSLETDEWTAVTASNRMAENVSSEVAGRVREQDRILIGNWTSDSLLWGETFDTVLMDYLVGAVEGFAPYWQERLFERLRPLVAGRVYLIGVEPYVPFPAVTAAGELVREIGCVRDACLLLAGERPYREFPMEWVIRHLGQAGFRLLDARQFPIIYRARFINGQLDMCLDRAARFASPELAETIRAYVGQLRERALAFAERHDGLHHGADYVLTAEPRR